MKLPPARIDAFLRSPDPSVRVVLIFGPDTGLVRERAAALAKKIVPDLDDPFRVTVLASADVAIDPARLMDEVAAQALGGGRRLVRVPHAVEATAAALAQVLKDFPPTDTLVLIEAGDLDKKSKLRALCEDDKESKAATIPCYVEEGEARTRVIAAMLREHGLGVESDALDMLAAATPPDRLALKSEIDKLALYALGQQKISLNDVVASLGDGSAVDFDQVTTAMGQGDLAALDRALQRLQSEGMSPVAILRAAQRHLLRLQLARGHMDSGASASEAIKKLRPPVFWKQEQAMVKQVQRWSSDRLARALVLVAEAEARCKITGTPDDVLCRQTLVTLAR